MTFAGEMGRTARPKCTEADTMIVGVAAEERSFLVYEVEVLRGGDCGG